MLANMTQSQGKGRLGRRRGARAAAGMFSFALGVGLAACGSDPSSQASARDRVTQARCDWAAACGYVGDGKTYSSGDNCLVQVRANWDAYWPAAECDGKIKSSQLDLCLAAIPLVACGDVGDLATSLAVNCSRAKICSGP